ncbi:MAG: cytochrome d ubiquinol oxidase subunit II [Propionibacteriaceae bacterium]|jgi:cytochrome d ubiquinol oxidase subunit II|nr:cytochrome d ubiquinol oxidase subunit II [Propionibacteriaceae bacterium]
MTIFEAAAATHGNFVLQVVWVILVAVLWIGFFVLEGFDFGVAMLVPFLGKGDKGHDDQARRVVINTIGPHWDANEVWLLTAGGAMFAAFPGWYATLFSGLYLPLFLVLLGLIVRGVAFEYRSKREAATWRRSWDWAMAIASFIPPLVLGVGFANFIQGVPIVKVPTDFGTEIPVVAATIVAEGNPIMALLLLFTPFTIVGGLLFVSLFLAHGAFFIALKTKGAVHERSQQYGNILSIVAAVIALAFVVWANLGFFGKLDAKWAGLENYNVQIIPAILVWIVGAVAVVALALAWFMNSKKRDGWAFISTTLAIAMLTVMMFLHFVPGLGFANEINLTNVSSSEHTLTLMTIAAGCLVPVVLAYTAWAYFFVFRRRLNTTNIPALTVNTQD